MKNGIPLISWAFRTAWTLIHFVIVAAAAAALLNWALADNRAVRIWETSKTNALAVQQRVSNVIPWPWAMDEGGENHSGGGENHSGGGEDHSGGGENRAGGSHDQGLTKRIKVSANLNVRVAPTLDAEVVKVLDEGTWVKADCKVENGDLVRNGPYGPSKRWDHVAGLGYISDAYVPTNTDGLPRCG